MSETFSIIFIKLFTKFVQNFHLLVRKFIVISKCGKKKKYIEILEKLQNNRKSYDMNEKNSAQFFENFLQKLNISKNIYKIYYLSLKKVYYS